MYTHESTGTNKGIAIMQPYFFPYIGYFQLLFHTDVFVFYDDVNYKKRGWINRNRILINDAARYLTIPCKNISQNVWIKDTEHGLDARIKSKLLKKVSLAYRSAPYFPFVFPLFEKVLDMDTRSIAGLASQSILETCSYLQINVQFKFSSQSFKNCSLRGPDRLIDICRKEQAGIYFNSMGGVKLYDKMYFSSRGITLKLLETKLSPYSQLRNTFIPGLSILDVMMFNDPVQIREMLPVYTGCDHKSRLMNSYRLATDTV